ncbi:MAG: superoxide dismutase [Eubacteriales bacterium]|nr:superoxide dismutase [Eubacteriales bacterium]
MQDMTYPFTLPPLPYPSYAALEPYLSAETVYYHYEKLFAGYVNSLNTLLAPLPAYQQLTLTQLLGAATLLPGPTGTRLCNSAGGVYNHAFYFAGMMPVTSQPHGQLLRAIQGQFGSFGALKTAFAQAGVDRFGSGWVWLCADDAGRLHILSTPYQVTLEGTACRPVLLCDVWEHAYYLDYKNDRAEYINNWWNLVDWQRAENQYLC